MERNKDFPSVPQACWLLLALFVAEIVFSAALHDLQDTLALTWPQSAAIVLVLANGVVLASAATFKGLRHRDLLHAAQSPLRDVLVRVALPALMLVPGLTLALGAASHAFARAVPLSDAEAALFARFAARDLATTLMVCAIGPVVEEMLFRGIVLRGFLHRLDRREAIAASALLFGVAHLNLYQFGVAFPLGLLLGWLYERTRSLWPCIALHVAYNSLVTLVAHQPDHGRAWFDPTIAPAGWCAGVALAAIGALLLARAARHEAFRAARR